MQFASDSATLFVLQVQKPGRQVAESVVSYIEFPSTLAQPFFHVFQGLAQCCSVPPVIFSNDQNDACREDEPEDANELCAFRNAERMGRANEPVTYAD